MKLLIYMVSFLAAISAEANPVRELVGQEDCGAIEVNDRFTSYDYLTNAEGMIKLDLSLEDTFSSENGGKTAEFRTDVIKSLTVQGLEIVHQPTGTTCAKWKKGGFIGPKSWVPTLNCKVITEVVKVPRLDTDGFKRGEICTRTYSLEVKSK